MWMTQMDTQVSKLKSVGLACLLACVAAAAAANDRDKAKRIHDRIATHWRPRSPLVTPSVPPMTPWTIPRSTTSR
jgi:hypothetical protein